MRRKIIYFYYPGKKFPAISVTGTSCALNCRHCRHKYLAHMIPAKTPKELLAVCKRLKETGASGVLISGGCDKGGRVPLEKFLPAIKRIKKETRLLINVHTGLIGKREAAKLAKTGIDAVSVDIVGDNSTIKEIYGINKTAQDYADSLANLSNSGIPIIAPHICIGIRNGRISGETAALRTIKKAMPKIAIINTLIGANTSIGGPRGRGMREPGEKEIKAVIARARKMLPHTHLVIGCMRQRKNVGAEIFAIDEGIDGIVLPSKKAQFYAKDKGLRIKRVELCCGLIGTKMA